MHKNFKEPFEFESKDRNKVKCKIETIAVASTVQFILTHKQQIAPSNELYEQIM